MTQLETQCLLHERQIKLFRSFALKYGEVLDDRALACFASKPLLLLHDPVLAGKVLGREGWSRERDEYRRGIVYNWTKEVLGVKVKIEGAETQDDLSNTTVPPKSFPLALEETSPSAADAVEEYTKTEEPPFDFPLDDGIPF